MMTKQSNKNSMNNRFIIRLPRFKKSAVIKGFTLAEVLITLAVIGVVASISIPSLQVKIREQTTVSKLKKVFSVFSQLHQKVMIGYGTCSPTKMFGASHSQNDMNTFFADYIKPNMNVAKDCGNATSDCWTTEAIKDIYGIVSPSLYTGSNSRYFILADGINVLTYLGDAGEVQIIVDVDGLKGDNTFGKDVFRLMMTCDATKSRGYDQTDAQLAYYGSSALTRIIKDNWKITFW